MAGNKSKSKDFSKNPALDFFSNVKIEREEAKADSKNMQEIVDRESFRKEKKEMLRKIVSMKPDESNLLSQDELDEICTFNEQLNEATFHETSLDDVYDDGDDLDNYDAFYSSEMYSKFKEKNKQRNKEVGKGRKIDPKENRDRRFSLSLTKSLYEEAREQAYQNRESLTTFILNAIENELKRCKQKDNRK